MRLQARDITVTIGGRNLVDGVSFDLAPGQIVAVVGRNGAGKSTLLKALTGDMPPTRGEVIVNNTPLTAWNRHELAKIRAVLPQSSPLNFGFTVLEVALMGRIPHLRGGETPEDYAIAHEALAAARVNHLADRIYTTLSGGERQRVQLARVLAQIWAGKMETPRYLLLDEPTSSLDLAHQHTTLEIAATFARQGVGILAILHDLNLAAQYADTIVMMHDGRRIAAGSPNDVLTPPLILEAFGIPVMVSPHPCYNCPLVIATPTAQPMLEIA